jgi:Cu(I)/Ag(I) efflux system membrane protein CusA/SilA
VFDAIISFSLRRPVLVLLGAIIVVVLGIDAARTMPVDVLPELTAPTVTVVTEAQGMSPEEVETVVTIPLEQALNGAAGVRRIRSSTAVGLSLIWVEFEWDVDLFVARQIVSERLRVAHGSREDHPEPVLAPATSIMGEIMFVGLTGDEGVAPRDLRMIADWEVRRALLAIPGVAQVVAIGGDRSQVQITFRPDQLVMLGLSTQDVVAAMRDASAAGTGSFHVSGAQEYLVRAYGRPTSLTELGQIVIARRDGVPVMIRDVATVEMGSPPKRGDAAVDGEPAVVLKIQKQSRSNTLELTKRIDEALDQLEPSLPKGVHLYRKGFRQAQFIRVAVDNVTRALLEAGVLVCVILAFFLMSWRTTVISLIALPLSLLAGVLVLRWMGASIDTMTLGGLAIAIGELVDDAIIDVENVHRRLRENAKLSVAIQKSTREVVLRGSREIRSSIVYATAIIVLAFMPLFFLSGLEGRLLVPLGVAFVTSIIASLLVALTVTPVLCMVLLDDSSGKRVQQSRVVRWLEGVYRPMVDKSVAAPRTIGILSVVGALGALAALAMAGRGFLPPFNEGALNIAAATAPGTSLEMSTQIAGRLETMLVDHPAVDSVIRITGRAEQDEHAMEVNFSELEVTLDIDNADRDTVIADIRAKAKEIPGLAINIGQPISHRIEHMLSGVRASLAVKLYGSELDTLRALARQAEAAVRSVPGTVDVAMELQTEVPHLVIRPRSTELAAFGEQPGELIRFVQMALVGEKVGTWWQEERTIPVVAKFPDRYRDDIDMMRKLPVDAHGAQFVPLEAVAEVTRTMGPNLINRENVERRIVVSANVSGRDMKSVAAEVDAAIAANVQRPRGYRYELGGSFESEAAASRTIVGLSLLAVLGMLLLLTSAFRSTRDALLVMVNLPLALVGGSIAVWVTGGVLTVASLVGFITLFGIASRNGIMMVTHYRQLMHEGMSLQDAVVEGSVHRLVPILMTALTAALALIPIAMASGQPGHEIQGPMAQVIVGGLISATLLNLVVLPALFARFAKVDPDAIPPSAR